MNDVMVCNLADHSVLLFPSKCTHWGSKASSKNQPIIIFYRVQQRQLASQCRKNVEKSFMQIYVSWRVCVAKPGDWSIFKMDP